MWFESLITVFHEIGQMQDNYFFKVKTTNQKRKCENQLRKLIKYFSLSQKPKAKESESEFTQSCLILCNTMDYSLPVSSVHGIFRQEYWSGLPFPSPGDLPDPGTEPWVQSEDMLSDISVYISFLFPFSNQEVKRQRRLEK